jgi:murein DD-endopeptidase MepM/ murein hydrolase activator NlpD
MLEKAWVVGLGLAWVSCASACEPAPADVPGPSTSAAQTTLQSPPDPIVAEGLASLLPGERLDWPLESVHITSHFGWRVDPVTGKGVRLHRGIDFRGKVGDLVTTIARGRVTFVGHDALLGTIVIVDHGTGVESLYGHLQDVLVHTGLPVPRGAAIGLVGNTGRSQAAHLHLTVKVHGVAIDPLVVLGQPLHAPEALAIEPDEADAPPDATSSPGQTASTQATTGQSP